MEGLSVHNLPQPLNYFFSNEDAKGGGVFTKTVEGITLKVSLTGGKVSTLMSATIEEGNTLLARIPQSLANQETALTIYQRFQALSKTHAIV